MSEIKIRDIVLPNKVLVGPMAGISDVSFRAMLAPFQPGLIYSEMISDKALIFKNQKTIDMCRIDPEEKLVALQLFGMDVDEMVQGAIYMDKHTNADIIDINMGCPAPKVVKGNGGASLMKYPELAFKIVEAVVKNVSKPVTVKMRTGWDDKNINAVEMAIGLEKAGASMISIHGRTRQQMYSGEVDFETIRKVKEAVSIPVIGNGSIRSVKDAREMIEKTGVDGIMISRGILSNPWLIEEINADLEGRPFDPIFDVEERFKWLRGQMESMIHYLGEYTAIKKMKGFASWFIAGIPNAKGLKSSFVRMQSIEEFDRIVTDYLNNRESDTNES